MYEGGEGPLAYLVQPLAVGEWTSQDLSWHTQTSFPITSCSEIGKQSPWGNPVSFLASGALRVQLLHLDMSLERGDPTLT